VQSPLRVGGPRWSPHTPLHPGGPPVGRAAAPVVQGVRGTSVVPRILALDCALARTSAAFGDAWAEAPGGHGQAAALAILAQQVLAGATPDAVTVTIGPGSFTGVRAALALARGIALGAGIPLIPVTTGEALAAAAPDGSVLAAIDSRRGHVFLMPFTVAAGLPRPTAAPTAWRPSEPLPAIAHIVGDAAPLLRPDTLPTLPDARDVARVARARLDGTLAPLDTAPLYIDPPAVRPPAALRPAPA
jgi:tRNA threonylcarbamoyladenosine biosynthesis protein TsaB